MAPARQQLRVIWCLSQLQFFAVSAGPWTRPRSYDAQRVATPIQIDGDIYTPEWEEVPWSENFVDIQGEDAPQANRPTAKTRTRMKMRWDDQFLYIAAEMSAHDWPIIADQTQTNSVIFSTDSDFEVFLDTDESNYNYKELEMNAHNTVWNLLLDKPYSDGGSEHSARVAKPGDAKYWEVGHQKTGAKMFGVLGKPNPDGKWTAEIALAHSDSTDRTKAATPTVGKFWRINFSRVEKKGKLNWVWSPQMLWSPTQHRSVGTVAMHYPDVWGYVHFVEPSPGSPASSWTDPQWPLKAAASQLFFAEELAVKETGTAVSLSVLKEKLWVNPSTISAYHPEIVISGSGKAWSAKLRDKHGCAAHINGEHGLKTQCTEALLASHPSYVTVPTSHFYPVIVTFIIISWAVVCWFGFERMLQSARDGRLQPDRGAKAS
mmetsp:Transcript_19798/g.49771  ORF Transcript_19798/g.49771 Transcript_19798/m.49771 type:complete len:432 (+) Transcript_19798:62-1357(+)